MLNKQLKGLFLLTLSFIMVITSCVPPTNTTNKPVIDNKKLAQDLKNLTNDLLKFKKNQNAFSIKSASFQNKGVRRLPLGVRYASSLGSPLTVSGNMLINNPNGEPSNVKLTHTDLSIGSNGEAGISLAEANFGGVVLGLNLKGYIDPSPYLKLGATSVTLDTKAEPYGNNGKITLNFNHDTGKNTAYVSSPKGTECFDDSWSYNTIFSSIKQVANFYDLRDKFNLNESIKDGVPIVGNRDGTEIYVRVDPDNSRLGVIATAFPKSGKFLSKSQVSKYYINKVFRGLDENRINDKFYVLNYFPKANYTELYNLVNNKQ